MPQKNTERIEAYILRDIRQNTSHGREDFTDDEIDKKTNRALLNHWLEWNGIIGYTGTIINVIENIYGIKLDCE